MNILDRIKNSAVYKVAAICAPFATIITCLVAFTVFSLNFYYSEAKVTGDISKYKYKNVVSYSGKLENESNFHADNLIVKGEIDPGKVVDFKVEAKDKIDSIEYNKPQKPITFSLNRLPKKNKCYFNIIVEPTEEPMRGAKEIFYVSWGKKGFESIVPKYVDEEDTERSIKRGIDLLSFNERDKWLKNNTKNISKRKK